MSRKFSGAIGQTTYSLILRPRRLKNSSLLSELEKYRSVVELFKLIGVPPSAGNVEGAVRGGVRGEVGAEMAWEEDEGVRGEVGSGMACEEDEGVWKEGGKEGEGVMREVDEEGVSWEVDIMAEAGLGRLGPAFYACADCSLVD